MSFFDRLAGGSTYDDFEPTPVPMQESHVEEEPEPQIAGQLPVDVVDTGSEIIVRAFVAGVKADEIDVSITRDKVEIIGEREERDELGDENYMYRELFWGSFIRTISLPVEVDVDASTAVAKEGLITITLPKLDKAKQTKLRVRGA